MIAAEAIVPSDSIDRAIRAHRRWSGAAIALQTKKVAADAGLLARLGATSLLWPVWLLEFVALRRLLAQQARSLEEARHKFFYIAALMMSTRLELNGDEIARVTRTFGRFRDDVLN